MADEVFTTLARDVFTRFSTFSPKQAGEYVRSLTRQEEGGEYSTIGPGLNEVSTTYRHGAGAHTIRFVNFPSPDILLVHQTKMVGFYLACSSLEQISPIPRDVKDHLLKDVRTRS